VIILPEEDKDEEYRLANINAKEISIVDNPAIDEGWIILKNVSKSVIPYKDLGKADIDEKWDGSKEVKEATVDDLKLMCAWYDSENADVKDSYKLPHHKASGKHVAVWNGVKSAMGVVLGAMGGVDVPDEDKKSIFNHLSKHYKDFDKEVPDFVLKISNDDDDNNKELSKEMADEKKEEEVTKVDIKEAAAKAATMLEEATGGSDSDKKRLKMLIGNLKSLGGVSKTEEEEEEMEKFEAAITAIENPDDVEKAGRKISKETASTLSDVSMSLKKSVKSIDAILKTEAKVEDTKVKSKKECDEEEDMKKSVDYSEQLNEIMKFYKDGLLSDDEIGQLLEKLNS
jgi:hypothetical protein